MNSYPQKLRAEADAARKGHPVAPAVLDAAADAMQDALTRAEMLHQERLELLREIATLRAWKGEE
jgi:hypothetical protein